jgi:carboxyl-terminal processing protease
MKRKILMSNLKMKPGLFATGMWLLLLLGGVQELRAQDAQANTLKFGRLLRLVESYYVDTTNINRLTEKAIVSMLQELDPHSVYITRDEVEKMNEPLKGNFEGIGVSFNIHKDTLLVVSTVPGGPSERTGIQAGDRILSIDGRNVAGIGLTNNDVFNQLRGEKGTSVQLKILRKNVRGLLDFTVIRDKIPINSLDASYMLDKETGYIKLNRFSATTMEEFKAAMEALREEKMTRLVLDLRNNGGGYLNAATDLAREFLSAGKMMVYTEGVHHPRKEYKSTGGGSFEKGNLVVLVNEGSASASEIVAGAIQDWDRGIIIGRRSYGKGLVQQPYYLTDGSMVRLTTAHYYTPSGRCIQKPYDQGVEDYRTEGLKRFENGEMFHADSIHVADSLRYKTLASGRTVYGGGGIVPDIFVPLDTSSLFAYYNRLQRNNIVYNYVLDYLDQNRTSLLGKYPTFDKFRDKFQPGEEMIEGIVAAGEKDSIARDQKSIDFTLPMMKREIRAHMARSLYTADHFYQIINEEDSMIRKAMEVLANQEQFSLILASKE